MTNKPYLVSRRRNTGEVVTESQRVCFMSGNVLSEIDNCVNVSVIVCYCDSLMKLVFISYGSVVVCFLFLLGLRLLSWKLNYTCVFKLW